MFNEFFISWIFEYSVPYAKQTLPSLIRDILDMHTIHPRIRIPTRHRDHQVRCMQSPAQMRNLNIVAPRSQSRRNVHRCFILGLLLVETRDRFAFLIGNTVRTFNLFTPLLPMIHYEMTIPSTTTATTNHIRKHVSIFVYLTHPLSLFSSNLFYVSL